MNCNHNKIFWDCKNKRCRKKSNQIFKAHYEFNREKGMIFCEDSGGYWYSDYRTADHSPFQ